MKNIELAIVLRGGGLPVMLGRVRDGLLLRQAVAALLTETDARANSPDPFVARGSAAQARVLRSLLGPPVTRMM